MNRHEKNRQELFDIAKVHIPESEWSALRADIQTLNAFELVSTLKAMRDAARFCEEVDKAIRRRP